MFLRLGSHDSLSSCALTRLQIDITDYQRLAASFFTFIFNFLYGGLLVGLTFLFTLTNFSSFTCFTLTSTQALLLMCDQQQFGRSFNRSKLHRRLREGTDTDFH